MATKKNQPAWNITTTTLVSLLGVALFTFLAGLSDDAGHTVVIVMWGLMLGWALINADALGNMVKAL